MKYDDVENFIRKIGKTIQNLGFYSYNFEE